MLVYFVIVVRKLTYLRIYIPDLTRLEPASKQPQLLIVLVAVLNLLLKRSHCRLDSLALCDKRQKPIERYLSVVTAVLKPLERIVIHALEEKALRETSRLGRWSSKRRFRRTRHVLCGPIRRGVMPGENSAVAPLLFSRLALRSRLRNSVALGDSSVVTLFSSAGFFTFGVRASYFLRNMSTSSFSLTACFLAAGHMGGRGFGAVMSFIAAVV
jgi:hypothetical protein